MAYIGREPTFGAFETQDFVGTGSQQDFVLDFAVSTASSLSVWVNNVSQVPNTQFNTLGTILRFVGAPGLSATIKVVYLGRQNIVPTVADGSVSENQITNGSVTAVKIANNAVNSTKIDIFKNTPDASAIYEINDSTTQGVLSVPKMTESQRDAISSPATSLVIYNTTTNKLNIYNGTIWEGLGSTLLSESNAADIFTNFVKDMEDHGRTSLHTEKGFVDEFEASNDMIDEANSSGFSYDATDDFYTNAAGGTNLNDDKTYTTQTNYIQQEWTNSNQSTSQATVSGTTVTLSSGTWPINCVNGRISFDSGSTFEDILTRDSGTQITLASAGTNATSDYIIRMSEFGSGIVKINSRAETETLDISLTAGTDDELIGNNSGGEYRAQIFEPTISGQITKVSIPLKTTGCTGDILVEIYAATGTAPNALPTGTALTSGTIDSSILTASYVYYDVTFSTSVTLTAGSLYAVSCFKAPATPFPRWQANTSDPYSDGNEAHQGASWQATTGEDLNVKIFIQPIKNVITEYISVADIFSQSTDVSAWSDINLANVTEDLNSQNAYYWLSFDPASNYGAGTEIVVPKPEIAAVYDGIDSNTAYISHFDGTNGSTTITDSSGNGITMTVSGGSTFLDTSIKKIGTASFRQASGAASASDWALSSANSLFDISTTDWTIDAWIYVTAAGNLFMIGENVAAFNNNLHFQQNSNSTTVYENVTGATNLTHTHTITPSTFGSWVHHAWVRQGTVLKSYKDGILNTTHTCHADYGWTGSNFYLKLGNRAGASGGFAMGQNGEARIDEFRFSRTARYTGNFTPSTTAYTSSIVTPAVNAHIRPIAKNDAGTWKHNINASANNTFTPATSTVNDMMHSVSQAVSSEAQNRLTGAELSTLIDADFNLTNGFSTSDIKVTRGLTLVSSIATKNPKVSLFRLNYDAEPLAIDLRTKQWAGTGGTPSAPSASPETIYLFVVDEQTSGTPVYAISRDGGVTYTTITFDASWVFNGLKSARRATVDVSSQPVGTDPRLKVTNSSGDNYKLHAVGLQTK